MKSFLKILLSLIILNSCTWQDLGDQSRPVSPADTVHLTVADTVRMYPVDWARVRDLSDPRAWVLLISHDCPGVQQNLPAVMASLSSTIHPLVVMIDDYDEAGEAYVFFDSLFKYERPMILNESYHGKFMDVRVKCRKFIEDMYGDGPRPSHLSAFLAFRLDSLKHPLLSTTYMAGPKGVEALEDSLLALDQ